MIYEKIIIYISSNRSYLRNVVLSVHDLLELSTISCKRAESDDTKLQNYSSFEFVSAFSLICKEQYILFFPNLICLGTKKVVLIDIDKYIKATGILFLSSLKIRYDFF